MSQKTQKIIAIILFLILLAAIPLTLKFGVQQQQQTEQKASSQVPRQQQYACGNFLTVILSTPIETPDCTGNGGNLSGLTSFKTSIIVKAKDGSQGAYQVKWAWAQFWCPTEDPSKPCLDNGTLASGQGGLTGNNTAFVTADSAVKTPTDAFKGQACGYYQNDFGFQVFDNNAPDKQLCGVSLDLNALASTNNNASWCHSTVTCKVTTPTPTLTTTPTPTPTVTITTTPTPTPTVTITPTSTPGPTSTPTPTIGITVTPTPRPTLPPTGPNNTILGIGLAGAAAAIIGAALLLAL